MADEVVGYKPMEERKEEVASGPEEAEVPTEEAPVEETAEERAAETYNGMVEKYGEKTGHKIEVTLRDREEELEKKRAVLEKAQAAFDEAPVGKEEKAEAALAKAQEEYDVAKAERDEWAAVKEEFDRNNEVEEEVVEQPRESVEESQQSEEERPIESREEEPAEEQTEQKIEPKPIGIGSFGFIYNQFKGKAKEAVAFLLRKRNGEAIGALHHKEVGDIDLVWGEEGTGRSDGYGLAKLAKYHPEVLDNLQEILDDMYVTTRSENRVQLESDTHRATVRLDWDNEKKNWLLTAYEKENSVLGNTTDTDKTSDGGKRNDTATPQNAVSDGKGTKKNDTDQIKNVNSSVSAVSEEEKQPKTAEVEETESENNEVREHRAEGETEEQSEWRKALGEGLDEVLGETMGEGYHTLTEEGQARIDRANGNVPSQKAAPTFYSNAEKSVEGIKQEKATAEQWLAMIQKAGGLKAGEDKWLGLSEWLKGQKGSLTKAEVLDYIRANEIAVEEVEYGKSLFSPNAKINFESEIARGKAEGKSVEEVMEAWDKEFDDEILQAYHNGEFTIDENGKVVFYDENAPILRPINDTRLQYTTEGLDNKREIAFVVPNVEPFQENDEIHFGPENEGRAVMWVRFGETTDADGKKVLVIDEIQSKRHQEGREKGYKANFFIGNYVTSNKAGHQRLRVELPVAEVKNKNTGEVVAHIVHDTRNGDRWYVVTDNNTSKPLSSEEEASQQVRKWQNAKGVPDAPFEKNWHEVAMKRMLRYAAENGYDKVAWTTGEQQAERYDLSKSIKDMTATGWTDYSALRGDDAKEAKLIAINTIDGGEYAKLLVDKSGKVISDVNDQFVGKQLSEIVGKDLAKRLMEDGYQTIEGDNLRIGGEGMKGFYDQILPRYMDKYGKKWGVKTGEVELPNIGKGGLTMWSVDVTPEMRESVMEGQPMFFRTPEGTAYGFTVDGEIYIDPRIATPETRVHEYAHLWAQGLKEKNPRGWEQLKSEMAKEADVIDYVKRLYPELFKDGVTDEGMEEVFAHYSGRRGAERLEREMQEEMAKANGVFEKAQVASVFAKIRDLLSKFWKMSRDLFAGKVRGIEKLKGEDFADMMLGDLLGHFDPGKAKKEREEKTLMGVHNISEEKLKKAIKNGGLANPSMAVIDTKNGTLSSYGEISLIPRSSLIDARTGRNAGTYSGDAYTPEYPGVTTHITTQGHKHIDKIAKDASEGNKDMERYIWNRLQGFIEDDSDKLHYLFLHQTGRNPEIIGEKTQHTHEEYEALEKIFGKGFTWADSELTDEQHDALLKIMMGDFEKAVDRRVRNIEDPQEREKARKVYMKLHLDNMLDENGKMWFAKWNSYVDGVLRDERLRQNPTIDNYGTDLAAENRVREEGLQDEYEQWKDNLLDEGDKEEKLFAGYTASGNRRYLPNTVENASKLMNKHGNVNAYNMHGLNATKATLLKRMRSLSDIRKHRDLLKGEDEYNESQKRMSDELFDIIQQISDKQRLSDNPFTNNNYAESRLQAALTERDPIEYLNREYGYNIAKNSELASQIMNFIEEAKSLPAKYFETKFKRPVMLEEFDVAVVPDNVSEEVKQSLEAAGLNVVEYEHDNEESRREATLGAVRGREGIMFQKALDNGEIQEMSNRISQWLSDENIEKAKGKTREEIIKMFGNEPQPIAMVPDRFLQYIGDNITDSHVYSGMGYFIDHAVNHHPTVEAQKYLNIQEVLNNPDEVKSIKDNGNDSIVFIKQIDRYNAVVIEVEKTKDGKIIWHKSFYDQKKKPYANKGVQLYDVSSGGGVSPIIRTDESAHDGSLSVLDDAAKVRTISETTKNNLQDAEGEGVGNGEVEQKIASHARSAEEIKEMYGEPLTKKNYEWRTVIGQLANVEGWLEDAGLKETVDYREENPTPTLEDYYISTQAQFAYAGPEKTGTNAELAAANKKQWEEMKASGRYEWHKSPRSWSEYLIDKETGDIYRYSNHWGKVASCYWDLDKKYGYYSGGIYQIGKCNIKDFTAEPHSMYDVISRKWVEAYGKALEVAKENIAKFMDNVKVTDAVKKDVEYQMEMMQRNYEYMNKWGGRMEIRYREGVDGENGAKKGYEHSEEERNGMVERAEALGAKLGTAIRVVDDVESLQHRDPEVLEKMKKAKGWYDRVSGRVTIVPGNIEDVEDAVATVMHEVVGHKGMRELVGKEDYDRFLDAVYGHLTDELKRKIDERVGRTFIDGQLNEGGRSYEEVRREAVDEVIAEIAEKQPEEMSERERSLWEDAKKAISEMSGREVSDVEMKYLLWREKEWEEQVSSLKLNIGVFYKSTFEIKIIQYEQ